MTQRVKQKAILTIVCGVGAIGAGTVTLATACGTTTPCESGGNCMPNAASTTDGGAPPVDGTADAPVPDTSVDALGAVPAENDAPIDSDAGGPPVTIVSLTPDNGSDNVYVNAPIEAVFSRPVKLGASPALLAGSGSVLLVTVPTLSADQQTMTLAPVSGLVAPNSLTAVINDVVDLSGNRSPSPAWSWTIPRWLTVGNALAEVEYLIAVAAGPGDQIAIAAYDSDASTISVYSAAAFNDSWNSIGSFSAPPNAAPPSLAVDPSGALIVCFVDNTNTVRVKRSSSSSWADVGASFASGASADRLVSMAIGPGGEIFVADDEVGGDAGTSVVVRVFRGGQWTQLGSTVGAGYWPEIAVAPSATPFVLFRNDGLLYVSSWSGSAWTPAGTGPVNLMTSSGGRELVGAANISMDDAGAPIVFGSFDNGLSSVFRAFRFSSSWSTIGDVLDTTQRGSQFPVGLSSAAGGHIYASWVSQGASTTTLGAADITSSGWTKLVAPVPTGVPQGTAAATDHKGNPVVAWPDVTLDGGSLQVRLLNR